MAGLQPLLWTSATLFKKGQVICLLEERDAQLKLDKSRAGLEQARFMLRQAQSRVGWSGDGQFDPEMVPEVASAHAAYESARASAKLAAADAQRYENLVRSGDVSQSNYEESQNTERNRRGRGQLGTQTI